MTPYRKDLLFATALAAAASLLVSVLFSVAYAQALPKIAADPYKVDGTEPDACSCVAPGAPPLTCTLASLTGGVQPKCDVSPISTSGTYNVTITVTRKEKITNASGSGSFVPAASATSTPFAYTRGGAALSSPIGATLTTQ